MEFISSKKAIEMSLSYSNKTDAESRAATSIIDSVEGRITIISDPLLSDRGPTRPVVLLLRTLATKGYRVKVVAPIVSLSMRRKLEEPNVELIDLGFKYMFSGDTSTLFETWIRETFFRSEPRKITEFAGLTINLSSCLLFASHVWYIQGPVLITVTVDSIYSEMPWRYKVPYKFARPLIDLLDAKFVYNTARASKMMFANSRYTAVLFKSIGLKIDGVIFPPVDMEKFRPTARTPSNDYILTYFGKETKYSTVKKVADEGIKIKAFGGKITPLSKEMLTHRNIEFLGAVDDDQLIDLYSNALFTFFPFTNEPFGYIPVESMSCGTPVLSFGRQGPAETVLNDRTGWLVEDDHEMVKMAKKLWKLKYDPNMRTLCVNHVKKNFDKKIFADKLLKSLKKLG